MANDDVECPYCEKWQGIDHDDGAGYEEDVLHQQECRDCGKIFVFTTSIIYSYGAEKADCLNEGEHTFEKIGRYPVIIGGKVGIRCSQCDEEMEIDFENAYVYGYNQDEINKIAKEQNVE